MNKIITVPGNQLSADAEFASESAGFACTGLKDAGFPLWLKQLEFRCQSVQTAPHREMYVYPAIRGSCVPCLGAQNRFNLVCHLKRRRQCVRKT